jgi:hypothetical protein
MTEKWAASTGVSHWNSYVGAYGIKSGYDGLFKSGLAISETTDHRPDQCIPCSTEQPFVSTAFNAERYAGKGDVIWRQGK